MAQMDRSGAAATANIDSEVYESCQFLGPDVSSTWTGAAQRWLSEAYHVETIARLRQKCE
jgi:hypothetical protein